MKMNINLNQSNKDTENAVNRIQNSLIKLQSVINGNVNTTNRNTYSNKSKNIRNKILDLKNNYQMKNNDILMSETNIQQKPFIGYSMFNNRSVIRTDKRNIQPNSYQQDLNNVNFERITNSRTDYIPKSNQSRNNNINKKNYDYNNNYNSVLKWKCMTCGNINLLYNRFCINCGKMKNVQNPNLKNSANYLTNDNKINYINNSYENINNNYNINNSNFITNSNNKNNNTQIEDNSEKQINDYNSNNPQPKDSSNMPNIAYSAFDNFKEFNPITSPENNNILDNNIDNSNLTGLTDNINKTFNMSNQYNKQNSNNKKNNNLIYKKLNDLYLYGDYLENELKESNDENIKLLEKYKNIKNDVHNLIQKNKKIRQNIEELQKKESILNKLNTQLKNGFSFVQQKVEKENNNNLNILKELEIENNKNIQKQKNYDNEIETLKKKINLLVKDDEEEENNEEEKNINEIVNNIEKDKKDILENNNKYILLLKDNELLNKDIEQLQIKLELNENNENLNEDISPQVLKKLDSLKEQMLLFDKEIKQNKMMTNNLIGEYKNLIEISENNINNKDIKENDKNEYLSIKEKNNKLTNELLKLKNIIKNLSDSKEKIIEIYEDEIKKLNNFYMKAKEKTMNNKKKENVKSEIDEEKIMKIIKENEEIKNENFELIKDLDKLAELQKIYQGLIEENKNLKIELKDSDLNEENQKLLNDIITDRNMNEEEEENNDD